jgi:hypothetical protein
MIMNAKKRTFKMVGHSLGLQSAEIIAYRVMQFNENFAHYNLSNNNLQDGGVEVISLVLTNTFSRTCVTLFTSAFALTSKSSNATWFFSAAIYIELIPL